MNWRHHTIEVGANRTNGYSGQEVTVRTDGKTYARKEQVRMATHVSLKELMEQLAPIFAEHPDADVDQQREKYSDDYYTVIEWWTPLSGNDPIVAEVLERAKAAEEQQQQRDKSELARLKKERPELFK